MSIMANDFEYLEDSQHIWPEGVHDTPNDDLHVLLDEWGIYKSPAIALKQLEEWYGRVHVSVSLEMPPCTGAQLRFERLKKEWIRGTEKLSNLAQIIMHPAYQQIIAIGPDAIPLILRSLREQSDHWFWALKMLNNNEDVAEGAETVPAAAAAWLKWGREKGYLGS